MIETIALVISAVCAGVINSIAGGGSLLTVPAHLFARVSVISDNAINTVVAFPGYLSATLGFIQELNRRIIRR